jgi:hypothetical protein
MPDWRDAEGGDCPAAMPRAAMMQYRVRVISMAEREASASWDLDWIVVEWESHRVHMDVVRTTEGGPPVELYAEPRRGSLRGSVQVPFEESFEVMFSNDPEADEEFLPEFCWEFETSVEADSAANHNVEIDVTRFAE